MIPSDLTVDPRETVAAQEARAIQAGLDAVALPPADLPGWQALCAREYAEAVRALQRTLAAAHAALSAAARS